MKNNKKILFTGIWVYLGIGCFAALLYCFFPSLSTNARDTFENENTIVVDTSMRAENTVTDTPAATEETPAPTEETVTPTPEATPEATPEPTTEPTPEPTPEPTEAPTEEPVPDSITGPIYLGTVNTGGLPLCLRDNPSLNASLITQVPNGSKLYAFPTDEESWYQVITLDGKNKGYSYKYIKLTEISEDDLPDAVKEALNASENDSDNASNEENAENAETKTDDTGEESDKLDSPKG